MWRPFSFSLDCQLLKIGPQFPNVRERQSITSIKVGPGKLKLQFGNSWKNLFYWIQIYFSDLQFKRQFTNFRRTIAREDLLVVVFFWPFRQTGPSKIETYLHVFQRRHLPVVVSGRNQVPNLLRYLIIPLQRHDQLQHVRENRE